MSDEAESSGEGGEGDGAGEKPTLLDAIMRHKGRGGSAGVILMIVGVGGLLIGGSGVLGLAAQPWELDASSPVAESVDSECGPFSGGRFVIEVGGEDHLCGGSDTKCGDEGPVAVAFDPEDPSRCRVAANVDGLSVYELQILILAFGFLALAIAGGAYTFSERLRLASLLGEGSGREVLRRRLRRVSGFALILAICLTNGFALYFILTNI